MFQDTKHNIIHLDSSPFLNNIIQEFLEEKAFQGKSPQTLKTYKYELRRFEKWLNDHQIYSMNQITSQVIKAYLDNVSKGHSNNTVFIGYAVIKVLFLFYDFQYEPENWKNPILKVKLRKPKNRPKEGIEYETVLQIVESCSGKFELRDKAIFLTMVSSGVRCTELCDLTIADIDFTMNKVIVNHGKGDKYRVTYISKDAKRALRKYLSTRKDIKPTAPLFLGDTGSKLNSEKLRRILHHHSEPMGITVGLHDFRRCFALTCYRRGMSVFTISKLLGHSSVETTKIYLNVSDIDLKIDYDKVDF